MIKNSTKMKATQSILSRFSIYLSSLQSLSHVPLFVAPWTAAWQASLSITNSLSSLKLMSIESVMPSIHLILCCPLLLLPSIFPSIRVFIRKTQTSTFLGKSIKVTLQEKHLRYLKYFCGHSFKNAMGHKGLEKEEFLDPTISLQNTEFQVNIQILHFYIVFKLRRLLKSCILNDSGLHVINSFQRY